MTRLRPVVIFDLDGTLVDSREDIAEAGNAARLAVGLPALPIAEVVACVGDGLHRLIERLTPEGDTALRAAAISAFQQAYAHGCTVHTRPYVGVPEALETLIQHGWTLAVATNKPLGFSQRILEHLGLAPRFATVRGGDTVKKPDPGQLRSIATELGADVATMWMVGDHHTDCLAAQALGCRALFCTWGIGHRDGHPVAGVADHASAWPRLIGHP
jgi:phosphoglycolate phosphatase